MDEASRRRRRVVAAVLALLLVVGVIAAIVVATNQPRTQITLHPVVYKDVQRSANAMIELVNENTQ